MKIYDNSKNFIEHIPNKYNTNDNISNYFSFLNAAEKCKLDTYYVCSDNFDVSNYKIPNTLKSFEFNFQLNSFCVYMRNNSNLSNIRFWLQYLILDLNMNFNDVLLRLYKDNKF